MKRRLLFTAALWPLLTAGMCATTPEPTIRTVEVKVPVPVPCKVDVGPEPAYPDTDEALRRRDGETPTAHVVRTTPLLVAGRMLRIARDIEKSAALEACAKG